MVAMLRVEETRSEAQFGTQVHGLMPAFSHVVVYRSVRRPSLWTAPSEKQTPTALCVGSLCLSGGTTVPQ